MITVTLTDAESEILISMLDELIQELSNYSCNDMFLDDTPENKALIIAAESYSNPDFDDYELEADADGQLYTMDVILLNYLKHRLEQGK